nr:MAG TPA: hypothetical protein [Caudoviricetes sp.]
MIACDEIITVVLHTQGDDDDTYTCITISNASWFCKTTINTSGDGAKPVNSFDVRFFETPDGFVPQLGAYVVKGIVEKIDMPSDLDGKEYFRITSIGNNRRGGLSHWRLSGQ